MSTDDNPLMDPHEERRRLFAFERNTVVRAGAGTGKTEAEAVKVAQHAMDLGVNLIDTARVYGTEGVVGQAIKGRARDSLVIVTKSQPAKKGELLPDL